MAILLISLIILFLTFSFGQLARLDIIPSIALSGLDIAVAIFVVFWGAVQFLKKELKMPPVGRSFFIFLGFALFSLLINAFTLPQTQVLAAFLYLLRFVCYSSLFFIVFSFTSVQKKLIYIVMATTGVLVVMIGYIQFFYYPALRNLYYGGWDEHYNRMFGTFLDPNFLGLFFVLLALLLLYLFFKASQTITKVLYGAMLGITIPAIFLTYSRSSLLALLAGITTFLFIKGNRKMAILFIGVILLGGAFTFFVSSKRGEGTNFFRTISSEARVGNMKDALTVWSDNVLVGVGFNAYRYAQHRHGIYQGGWEEGHGTAGADNSFLFVLATTGILGLGAFLYFFFKNIQILKKSKDNLKKSLGIATIISLSVGSFFINGLFYPSLMLWLGLILALTESR